MPWLLISTALAGPWVQAPGHAYLKAGTVRFTAEDYVDPQGDLVQGTAYRGDMAHLYGEVGLIGPVQAVFNVPFVSARNRFEGVDYVNRAGGDAELGLAAGTDLGPVPVSLTARGRFPLYDNASLLELGDSGSRVPAMGDGQVDVDVVGATGHGVALAGVRGWVAGEAGYRHRTGWWLGDSSRPDRDYLDGLLWRAQLGWSPRAGERDLGWLSADIGGIKNLETDAITKQYSQVGVSGGAKLVAGLALEAGYSRMIWARASSQGQSVSAGLSWKR